jgi:hypothetical protein
MQSIDVHPTIAALLGIAPSPSADGHARTELLATAGAPTAVPAAPVHAAAPTAEPAQK